MEESSASLSPGLDAVKAQLSASGYAAFAEQVDTTIAMLCERWGISEVLGPMPGGLSGVTLRVRLTDGRDCVLKVAPPSVNLVGEATYLADAQGVVPVPALVAESVAADNALLMEYLPSHDMPFDPSLPVEEHLRQAWELISALGRMPTEGVADQSDRVAYLDQRIGTLHEHGRIPDHLRELMAHGAGLAQAVLAGLEDEERQYCHGDFWAPNLLRTTAGQLVAIDPQPCVGDPALDLVRIALGERAGSYPPPDAAARLATAARMSGIPHERIEIWAAFRACRNAARSYSLGGDAREVASPAWEHLAQSLLHQIELRASDPQAPVVAPSIVMQ